MNYETKLDLAGESLTALIQYEIDEGDGANAICISSVSIRRCIKQRGDMSYDTHGDAYIVVFPEYIELEIFQFLKGSQLKALAEEIYANLDEQNWNEVMNEPRYSLPRSFPSNYPGVRL